MPARVVDTPHSLGEFVGREIGLVHRHSGAHSPVCRGDGRGRVDSCGPGAGPKGNHFRHDGRTRIPDPFASS
jgi:hypothetical protein